MTKNIALIIFLTNLWLFNCSSQQAKQATDNIAVDQVAKTDDPMVVAGLAFLGSLTPELQKKTQFPFEASDRENWHFVPQDDRNGARIGLLNDTQRELAFDLLQTGLSERGYEVVREIMALEKVLIIKEKQETGSDYRNPTKYYLAVFGQPSSEMPWSWTYEGHHISLNYTSVSGKISVTPAFLGSNPAEIDVEHPDRGKRVLGDREDLGRSFMLALDAGQQAKALIQRAAYPEIITGTESIAQLDAFEGLPFSEMTDVQQLELVALIQMHLNIMKPTVSSMEWEKIKANGLENLHFAWAGSLERYQKHYYRIHGPSTIIEYDNAQNNGNHAHIVWRDPSNDFGRDLLQKHHQERQH